MKNRINKTDPGLRWHPLFQTPEEAKAHPEDFFSDHLAYVLRPRRKSDKNLLNILSYNPLGALHCSGMHDPKTVEKEEETKERYERTTKGLARAAVKHDLGIIGLQEAGSPHLLDALKTNLADHWEIIEAKGKAKNADSDPRYGIITCFDKNKFTLLGESNDDKNRIHTLILQDNETDEIVFAHNIWGNYTPISSDLEKTLETALTKYKDRYPHAKHVIFGDTNSRYAYVGEKFNDFINLTTGIIPLGLNKLSGVPEDKQHLQFPDHPDFGLHIDEDGHIRQIEPEPLDLQTSKIVRDKRKKDEMPSNGEAYRMVICSDHYYKETPLIQGKTIFGYEKDLRKRLNLAEQTLLDVRIASNIFNQKAVGMRFGLYPKLRHVYSIIEEILKKEEGVQCRWVLDPRHGCEYPCIFVPLNKAYKLDYAINAAMCIYDLTLYAHTLDGDYNKLNTSQQADIKKNRDSKKLVLNLISRLQEGHTITVKDIPPDNGVLKAIISDYQHNQKRAERENINHDTHVKIELVKDKILNEFESYKNPKSFSLFKKSSRTFNDDTVNIFQDQLTKAMNRHEIAKAFVMIEWRKQYVKDCKFGDVKDSSLYKRLDRIQYTLQATFPDYARLFTLLHEQLKPYLKSFNDDVFSIEKAIMSAIDDTKNTKDGENLLTKINNAIRRTIDSPRCKLSNKGEIKTRLQLITKELINNLIDSSNKNTYR